MGAATLVVETDCAGHYRPLAPVGEGQRFGAA
jgi:hypothetical protein